MNRLLSKIVFVLVLQWCFGLMAKTPLSTQYIAPIENPSWANAVVKGEYGTGRGIDYVKTPRRNDYDDGYFNWRIEIGGASYFAFNIYRAFLNSPGVYTRSVLHVSPTDPPTASPARRYLYPLPDFNAAEMYEGALNNSTELDNQAVASGWDKNSDGAVYVQCIHTDWVYQVTFNAGGGTGTMPMQAITNSGALAANRFTRTGYSFAGWQGERTYDDKAVVTPSDDMILNARWNAITYSISYDGNGSTSGSMSDSTSLDYDRVYTLRENGYSKTGLFFQGWSLKRGGEVAYADKADVKNLTDQDGKVVTLYAVWGDKKVNVSFDPSGGVVSPSEMTVTYGKNYPVLPEPDKSGYMFAGWYDAASNLVDETTVVAATSNHVLYAHWNNYEITLDANGGEFAGGAALTNVQCVLGGNYPGDLPVPSRDGCDFAGWWTRSGEQKTSADTVEIDALHLTARWKESAGEVQEVRVIFAYNDGIAERALTNYVAVGSSIAPFMPGSVAHSQSDTYLFIGWFLGDKKVSSDWVVERECTFTAKWSERYYNELFGLDDVLFTSDDSAPRWKSDGAGGARSGEINDASPVRESILRAQFFADGRLSFDWRAEISSISVGGYNFQNYFSFGLHGEDEYEKPLKAVASGEGAFEGMVQAGREYEWKLNVEEISSEEDFARIAGLKWEKSSSIDSWDSAVELKAAPTSATFETGGATNWVVTSDVVDAGMNAIAITNLAASRSSYVSMSVKGAGELRFKWKVSSEAGYVDLSGNYRKCDYLEFLDGVNPVAFIDGDMDGFVEVVYTNAADSVHTFSWRYVKDSSVAGGEDSAFVDSVRWTSISPKNPEPTEADRPTVSSFARSHSGLELKVENASDLFDYQIRGTANLLDAEPWPLLKTVPGMENLIIVMPLTSSPQMFYRLEVVRKQD